jgi:hypothetical protein
LRGKKRHLILKGGYHKCWALGGTMKKVLVVFLVFAYMNCYLGCTTSKKMIITDKEVDTGTNNDDLIVMTIDSTCYFFEANMYRFKNDSLDGIATIYGEEHKQRMKIALNDIIGIGDETTENKANYLGLIGGTIGVLVLVIGVFVLIGMSALAKNK